MLEDSEGVQQLNDEGELVFADKPKLSAQDCSIAEHIHKVKFMRCKSKQWRNVFQRLVMHGAIQSLTIELCLKVEGLLNLLPQMRRLASIRISTMPVDAVGTELLDRSHQLYRINQLPLLKTVVLRDNTFRLDWRSSAQSDKLEFQIMLNLILSFRSVEHVQIPTRGLEGIKVSTGVEEYSLAEPN